MRKRAKVSRRNGEAVARAEGKRKRPPEHRERERVRLATRRAIDSGRLIRGNCERCGSPFTHAHHEDYSQPFEINWFCPYHHAERHRERVAEAGLNRN